MTNKYILAISGNDIFSGGGLYADLATYTTNHLHGFLAVTCLTAVTDKGFEVFATDNDVFAHQLNSLKDVEVSALRDELLKFFPYATIITPNLVEAELLAQTSIKTLDDMKAAAKLLYDLGVKNVVIKGGNRLSKEKAIDIFYDGSEFSVFENDILDTNNIGAGCTLASSIASQLVLGKSPKEAVAESKEFVFQAIRHSDQYGVKQNYEQD